MAVIRTAVIGGAGLRGGVGRVESLAPGVLFSVAPTDAMNLLDLGDKLRPVCPGLLVAVAARSTDCPGAPMPSDPAAPRRTPPRDGWHADPRKLRATSSHKVRFRSARLCLRLRKTRGLLCKSLIRDWWSRGESNP